MDQIIRSAGVAPNGWIISDEGHGIVDAISESIQHSTSHDKGHAYQVKGTATPAAATVVVLHLKNISSDKDMVINYIRCQLIDPAGGTAVPSASVYFRMAFDRTYGSGGSLATISNMNTKSGNTGSTFVTAYQGAPTLAGTADEFDVEYVKAEGEVTRWSKEGSIIIGPNGTLEVALVGDHTSGTAYARVSFLLVDPV